MTIDELIEKLQKISKSGKGNNIINFITDDNQQGSIENIISKNVRVQESINTTIQEIFYIYGEKF